MNRSAIRLSVLSFLTVMSLVACYNTEEVSSEPDIPASYPWNEDALMSLGFLVDEASGMMQLQSLNGHTVEAFEAQVVASLSAAELAFQFDNVAFPTTMAAGGGTGTMTVDLQFDNKIPATTSESAIRRLEVDLADGPTGIPDASQAKVVSVTHDGSTINLQGDSLKPVASNMPGRSLPVVIADDVGGDDFTGTDAFILSFEVNYTASPFEFFIDLKGELFNAESMVFDLVNGASLGLTSRTLTPSDGSPSFASADDIFGIILDSTQVATSLYGENLNKFFVSTLDTFEPFFLIQDASDASRGSVTAVWEFDISELANPMLSIDMAALGNFDTTDTYTWEVSIDGGGSNVVFDLTADTSSNVAYSTLDGAFAITFDDPLELNSTELDNNFRTFTTNVVTGSSLVLTLSVDNLGTEAYLFKNIVIQGN